MINLYKLHNRKLDNYEKYADALESLDYIFMVQEIRRHDQASLRGIRHIIKGSPRCAFNYAGVIIRGRWIEAEPTIMKSPFHALQYARHIIKGRWEEAEPIIKKSNYWKSYCEIIDIDL